MITTDFAPFDSLLVNLDENGKPCSFNSDVSLLKRKEVLDMLPRSIDSLVDNGSFNNPYDGMSDDEIINNTKSRRIQSPSELKDWSESISEFANYKKAQSKKSKVSMVSSSSSSLSNVKPNE